MNGRIGLGLLLVAAGLLVVILGLGREQALVFVAVGLLAEAGGLYLIYSGSPKKKQ